MAGDEELEPTTTVTDEGEQDEQFEPAGDVEFAQAPLDDDDELPPPGAEEEGEATAEAPEPPEGVTVDEKGRWRNPDGTFASKQPTKEAEESVKAEVAATPPPPAPDPNIQPWKPNIYGNEVELIPGAKFHPEHGLLIPVAQLPNATALMARGTKYDEVKQERQRFAQERESLLGAAKFENESLATILMNTLYNEEFRLRAATDWDSAKREVEFALREAQLNLKEKYGGSVLAKPTPDQPPQNQQDPGDLDPYDAELGLRGWITETLSQPAYHGLFTAKEQDALVQRLMAIGPFAKHEGQWALDTLVASQFVDALADAPRREQARKAEEEKRKAAEAATKRNEAAVPKPTAPPTKRPAKGGKSAKSTPDYTDRPWDDPKLSKEERREALRRKVLGK